MSRVCLFCFRNVQYIERDSKEHYHTIKVYPEDLNKKVTLLKYFRNYMSEHLLKVRSQPLHTSSILAVLLYEFFTAGVCCQAGANMTPRESDDLSRLPFLRTWFRTRSAIVLHLSNGTLQVSATSIELNKSLHKTLILFYVKKVNCCSRVHCLCFRSTSSKTTRRSFCVRWWAPARTSTRNETQARTASLSLRSSAAPKSSPVASATRAQWPSDSCSPRLPAAPVEWSQRRHNRHLRLFQRRLGVKNFRRILVFYWTASCRSLWRQLQTVCVAQGKHCDLCAVLLNQAVFLKSDFLNMFNCSCIVLQFS